MTYYHYKDLATHLHTIEAEQAQQNIDNITATQQISYLHSEGFPKFDGAAGTSWIEATYKNYIQAASHLQTATLFQLQNSRVFNLCVCLV